jgi:DNA repair protein RecN (Recombination protein N)
MLKELSIRNFAIIDDIRIRFSGGLTILSGETGAGKSILINAVNLILGKRASAALIRTGCKTAELEAFFQIACPSTVAELLSEHGHDPSEGLIVRRIISRSDNNRIYINGRLATMQVLNVITENLASISGQHAHQGLLKEEEHLAILDRFAGLLPLQEKVSGSYHELLLLIEKLDGLESLKRKQADQIELLEFQKAEITDAAIEPEEDQRLEQERARLKNSEYLYQTVYGGIEELYSSAGSIDERLVEVKKSLEKAGHIDKSLESKIGGLAEMSYQLGDLVEELRSYLKTVQMNPDRLEEVEDRLDQLNRLQRKYGGSLKSVATEYETICNRLTKVQDIDGEIAEVQAAIAARREALFDLAVRLSKKRKAAAASLAAKVIAELDDLSMSKSQLQVMLQTVKAEGSTSGYLIFDKAMMLRDTGFDKATIFIAPNVGEALKPLTSIASGGELSRVVLALKAILAVTDSVETVIFDEVDAGIGGGVAEVVGQKLAQLARHHQIICITHLPQIAKFGSQHYNISKAVTGGRTRTVIRELDEAGRIEEIARMLGGVEITPATLAHAREMIKGHKIT